MFQINQKGFAHLFLILILLIAGIGAGVYLVQHPQIFSPKAAPVTRGESFDQWADVIIGKPSFSEINPYTTVDNKLWLPHGVIVDRSKTPNVMYVYDGGNNRILGFDLSKCLASTTDPLNCKADIVLGQRNKTTSACNGDSAFQNWPERAPASAESLCGTNEGQLSVSEGGSGASMAVDSQSNLYVFDAFNNRVLKYKDPYSTDQIADEVWGQENFTDNKCNKGKTTADNSSLCYSWGDSNNWTVGVDIDSAGNLWVVDSGNNRVLRFPSGSKTADLVLGQGDFSGKEPGNGLNKLHDPSVVRVNSTGRVYVADVHNQRVLTYDAPFTNGMQGTVFGSGFGGPEGLDFDPTEPNNIWVSDLSKNTLELWGETSKLLKRTIGRPNDGNLLGDASGSVGFDSLGNAYVAIGAGASDNDVLMFDKSASTDWTKRLFGEGGNQPTSFGMSAGAGLAVSNNQLIVTDIGRILFWNNPAALTNGKSADGVTGGTSDFNKLKRSCCSRAKADKANHLWVVQSMEGDEPHRIEVYQLPLTTGALPIKTINLPIPVLGGGQITSVNPYHGGFTGIAPTANGEFLWVSQGDDSRVFRLRNPLTSPTIDVILGQDNFNATECNRGGAIRDGATPTSLCYPGALSLDKLGNLYVSDHSLEIRGNARLLEFNKQLFPENNTQVIYAPAASKIFPDIATWEPAFNSKNQMVVGFNPYWTANAEANPNGGWFPGMFSNPLASGVLVPDKFLKDYHSMAFAATFDDEDNLYVGDLNRGRVLIYKKPFGEQSSPSPSLSPSSTPKSIDSDDDGFTDAQETFMGTNLNRACPLDSNDNAWPVDLNNDRLVNGKDSSYLIQYTSGAKPYDKRVDLNQDGVITQSGDVPVIQANFLKVCVPLSTPTPTPTPTVKPSPSNTPTPTPKAVKAVFGDFDGDGRAEFTVFRPSTAKWYIKTRTGDPNGYGWGAAEDIPVMGDYNGDGKMDKAVYRPSLATWYVDVEGGNGVKLGNVGDIPVPADYNGDGKMDKAVYQSNGTWLTSVGGIGWGRPQDAIAVPADYNGDGKAEPAWFLPSSGSWFIQSNPSSVVNWGGVGDIPVPADYDGDGKADLAVFRNGTWYIRANGFTSQGTSWGQVGDIPVPADYAAEGKVRITVFRPANGTWYVYPTKDFSIYGTGWGQNGDIPATKRPAKPGYPF